MSKPISSSANSIKSPEKSSSSDRALTHHLQESATLLLVESKAPWYAPGFVIKKKFKQAVAEYQNQKGLMRKAFTIGPAGYFGGLYVWSSRTELDCFYTEKRIEEIEKKRGVRPRLTYYKLIDYYDTGVPLRTNLNNAREWDGNFIVTVAGTAGSGSDNARKRFAIQKQGNYPPGLITNYLVTDESSGQFCELKLWQNRRLAKSAEKDFSVLRQYEAPTLIEGTSLTN